MDIINFKSASVKKINRRKIQHIRFLTKSTFVITIDRDNLEFIAGQHVIVGIKGSLNQREYSVYNSEKRDHLEILVKEVIDGNVSMQLRHCKEGNLVEVNGPFGSFKLETKDMYSRKHLFIATGTGISPFHSMVASYPGINYTLLHGIRYPDETYDKHDYDPERYIPCISTGGNGKYNGRVTDFLPDFPDEADMIYYLCGNSSMIYDVCNILRKRSVSAERILTEVYF